MVVRKQGGNGAGDGRCMGVGDSGPTRVAEESGQRATAADSAGGGERPTRGGTMGCGSGDYRRRHEDN
jgi:hypothetical protein